MENTLRQFMAKLALDPDALSGLLNDREAMMARHHVDERDRDLIRNPQPGPFFARLSVDLPSTTRTAPATTNSDSPVCNTSSSASRLSKGSLVVVGTGIRSVGQLTVEAIAHIKHADRVFYLVAEPIAVEVIHMLNPSGARSLGDLYQEGKPRRSTYEEMVERVMQSVRSGLRTCAVFYGHPGVFVDPAHTAISVARQDGFRAEMLPGISAEDCMFADVGIDPASGGCQSYEATDFLVNRRHCDPTSHLVIWQAGVLGDRTFSVRVKESNALELLVARLMETYPPTHRVCIYEAAVLPGCPANIQWTGLSQLDKTKLSIVSTLYFPPSEPPQLDVEAYFALSGLGRLS